MPPPEASAGARSGNRHPLVRLVLLAALTGAGWCARADEAVVGEHGLPFTRFYSYEEIGNASRGMRLNFDPLGRIAMTRGGSCIVLNDTTWVDLADREGNGTVMQRLVFGPDGQAYFGAFGLWGMARLADNKLEPLPMVPADAPKWIQNSNFNEIVAVSGSIWFGGFNGIVHWDRQTDRHHYYQIPGIGRMFLLGGRLYFSSYAAGVGTLDPASDRAQIIRPPPAEGVEIDQVAPYDATRVITSDLRGRLRFFDGHDFTVFPGPLGERPLGRATALTMLPDGNIAVAITGAGVHLVAPDGKILSALTAPEYHRVTDLVSREPGVLWLVNENGIEKVLYNNPLTSFGQRQGLPLSWPQVVRWNGRIVVASGGQLYAQVPGQPGEMTRFQPMSDQPAPGVWAIATAGDDLLIGTKQALYTKTPQGGFETVLNGFDVARLVYAQGVMYALGATEIAALRKVNGRWTESAPRVPGVGYPNVVHGTGYAAWIELGLNRAARVRERDGKIDVRIFDQYPWASKRWINIGWAGATVALSGMPDGRVYFDEESETVIPQPPLGRLLDQAPFIVTRFRQDSSGTIWGTHDEGLLSLRMQDGLPVFDTTTFGRINDRFPLPQLLDGNDLWLLTGQSLYHLNHRAGTLVRPAFHPVLVSLTSGRTNRELLSSPGVPATPPTLAHEDNSLVFRFFSGSYASRHPPTYEFKLRRGNDSRPVLGNGSLLTLTNLREGNYELEAQLVDAREPVARPLVVAFCIAPPWYRTWYAYALCALAAGAAVYGLVRWSGHRTRSRNVVLERLVAERTEELRSAMQQLNEETRNAATLAERDRLAGEIHDSVQQGLSGLMLHLDATLKLPHLPAEVRSRLGVARNMVSFTRHEVQHAVWDMETPLLEGTELGEALQRILALIGPGAAQTRVTVTGKPIAIPSAVKHNLLRIAQEAITNAVRHAASHHITVTLAYEPEVVTLRVVDDGNGFVPQAVLRDGFGHFGLRGLRGRAEKIGGELQINSTPGQGTTVQVSVPVNLPVV